MTENGRLNISKSRCTSLAGNPFKRLKLFPQLCTCSKSYFDRFSYKVVKTPLVQRSNPKNAKHKSKMPQGKLLCCCSCFPSDDNTAERSLLKPSWFRKVRGSNHGAQDEEDSVKWWRQGCKSIRQADEWCESVVENYLGPKWKRFVQKCHPGGKFICKSNRGRLNYDRISYKLNFDQGFRDFDDHKTKTPCSKKGLR